MDIRCPRCLEPWDHDELHERAAELESTHDEVSADFRRRGCVALGGSPCERDGRSDVAAIIYELAGDDMDGAASDFEDAEFLGLL